MMVKSILIIEDDWHFRVILETALLAAGHEVRSAENGKAGVIVATSWHPNLVIMDLEMPIMDGIPTIYILREKGYRGFIAVVSGNLTPENVAKAREAGATHFFAKPFSDDPRRMVDAVFADVAEPKTDLEAVATSSRSTWTPSLAPPTPITTGYPLPSQASGKGKGRMSTGWFIVNGFGIVLLVVGILFGIHRQTTETGHRPQNQGPLPRMAEENPETVAPSSVAVPGSGVSRKANMVNRQQFFHANQLSEYYCRHYLRVDCTNTPLRINPLGQDLDVIDQGRESYFKYCLRCHGPMGQGDGPDAVTLKTPPGRLSLSGSGVLQKDAFLFWTLAEGGAPLGSEMPAFREILSEKKIWSLIRYLETL